MFPDLPSPPCHYNPAVTWVTTFSTMHPAAPLTAASLQPRCHVGHHLLHQCFCMLWCSEAVVRPLDEVQLVLPDAGGKRMRVHDGDDLVCDEDRAQWMGRAGVMISGWGVAANVYIHVQPQ